MFSGDAFAFFLFEVSGWLQILIIAGISLATWIPVSLWGPQNDPDTLEKFARRIQPAGPGWQHQYQKSQSASLWPSFIKICLGLIVMYGTLFGIGDLIFGRHLRGSLILGLAIAAVIYLWRSFQIFDDSPKTTSETI